MSNERKEICSRCGWYMHIVHRGQVKRREPFKGFSEVKYCKPCYDFLTLGSGASAPDRPATPPGLAVTNYDQHGVPKSRMPEPGDVESEIAMLKLRAKIQWFATGLVAGLVMGIMLTVPYLLRGAP